jgi:hypothetical protein
MPGSQTKCLAPKPDAWPPNQMPGFPARCLASQSKCLAPKSDAWLPSQMPVSHARNVIYRSWLKKLIFGEMKHHDVGDGDNDDDNAPRPRKLGRVAAKMSVVSGRRCPAHYQVQCELCNVFGPILPPWVPMHDAAEGAAFRLTGLNISTIEPDSLHVADLGSQTEGHDAAEATASEAKHPPEAKGCTSAEATAVHPPEAKGSTSAPATAVKAKHEEVIVIDSD